MRSTLFIGLITALFLAIGIYVTSNISLNAQTLGKGSACQYTCTELLTLSSTLFSQIRTAYDEAEEIADLQIYMAKIDSLQIDISPCLE